MKLKCNRSAGLDRLRVAPCGLEGAKERRQDLGFPILVKQRTELSNTFSSCIQYTLILARHYELLNLVFWAFLCAT